MTKSGSIAVLFSTAISISTPATAEARTLIRVDAYQSYICMLYYDDNSSEIGFCPTDWPPPWQPLTVGCNCEHYGSPFDDICEAWVGETNWNISFGWNVIGYASIYPEPDPYSGFAWFSCPHGIPPSAYNCTVEVTVYAPSGATGTALCYSN